MAVKLSPSASHRWSKGKCTRFPHFASTIPYKDNGNGHEGECAHWVLENYMKGVVLPVGTVHKNGTAVNSEMHDKAIDFLKYMAGYGKFEKDLSSVNVNTHSHLEKWHSETKYKMFYGPYNGIIDCWLYDPNRNILFVYDYKYGFTPVSAVANTQLVCYAETLIHEHNIPTEGLQLCLGIYQPRDRFDEINKTWNITYNELEKHVTDILEAVAEVNAGGVCRIGSHCAYCPAMSRCPSSKEAVIASIKFESIGDMCYVETNEELGNRLTLLDALHEHLTLRRKVMMSEVEEKIKAGETVPGWANQSCKGKLEWDVPIEQLIPLESVYNVKLTELKAKTPTQAKKLPIPKDIIDTFAKRKPNWFKLKKVSSLSNPFQK